MMFAGERINVSENRSVLHVALRMPKGTPLIVDRVDVVAQVHEDLDRMADFATKIRSGAWKGHTGKPIRNIVNIGIGGSVFFFFFFFFFFFSLPPSPLPPSFLSLPSLPPLSLPPPPPSLPPPFSFLFPPLLPPSSPFPLHLITIPQKKKKKKSRADDGL